MLFFTAEDWDTAVCLAETDQIVTSSNSIQEQQIIVKKSALKCPKPNCDFETLKPCHLKIHENSHLQCNVCFKEFSGKHARQFYKRHQRVHNIKIAHICDVCQKPFQYRSNLKTHKIRSKCGRQ